MKINLEKARPEDFEQLGKETMQSCWEMEQAVNTCTPVLQAYELALRPGFRRLESELAAVKNQTFALRDILYNRLVPVNDAVMLAHTRKICIVTIFTFLTGLACLIGNAATFYLMGAGSVVAMLGAIGMTALPLGIGHIAYEWIISLSGWIRVFVVLVTVVLAGSGIVIAGHARREMIDRAITTPSVSSYVEGENTDDHQQARPTQPAESSDTQIRRTLGEGLFLFVLAAELGLAFLVGWLIELYGDYDNTAWRKLQSLREQASDVEAAIVEWITKPEVAKRCCLAGILAAHNSRSPRRPPYHQALTMLLIIGLLFAAPLHAQSVQRYEGILIDTSASISRGGRSNELFRKYLKGVRELLLTTPPNTRVWVLRISSDSFGGPEEIVRGWTPDAHGVFTDDLERARRQLAAAFEKHSVGMAPSAPATDIFGGLERMKVLAEAATQTFGTADSTTIFIFSDMLNETGEFPIPALLQTGPERMFERAKAAGFVVPLPHYDVYVYGAATNGLAPEPWMVIRRFWETYFSAAGAHLVLYSSECEPLRPR